MTVGDLITRARELADQISEETEAVARDHLVRELLELLAPPEDPVRAEL